MKHRIGAIALCFLLALPSPAAIAVVSHTAGPQDWQWGNTLVVGIPSTTSGNLLVVTVNWAAGSGSNPHFNSITCNTGACTFEKITGSYNGPSAEIYWARNIPAGVTSVTFVADQAPVNSWGVTVWEISGADQTAVDAAGSGSHADYVQFGNQTFPTITTSATHTLILGGFYLGYCGLPGVTLDSGFTQETFYSWPCNNYHTIGAVSRVVSSAGSYSTAVVLSGSEAPRFSSALVALKEEGSSSAPQTAPSRRITLY